MEYDLTIRIREIIAYGKDSGVFGESEFALLERVV